MEVTAALVVIVAAFPEAEAFFMQAKLKRSAAITAEQADSAIFVGYVIDWLEQPSVATVYATVLDHT